MGVILDMEPWIAEGDVLIGISVHGGSDDAGPWSQNLAQAMALAKQRNARTIGFSGFGGGAMKAMGDVCIVVPINSEPFSAPLVESFHVAAHHLVCAALRERPRA